MAQRGCDANGRASWTLLRTTSRILRISILIVGNRLLIAPDVFRRLSSKPARSFFSLGVSIPGGEHPVSLP